MNSCGYSKGTGIVGLGKWHNDHFRTKAPNRTDNFIKSSCMGWDSMGWGLFRTQGLSISFLI